MARRLIVGDGDGDGTSSSAFEDEPQTTLRRPRGTGGSAPSDGNKSGEERWAHTGQEPDCMLRLCLCSPFLVSNKMEETQGGRERA